MQVNKSEDCDSWRGCGSHTALQVLLARSQIVQWRFRFVYVFLKPLQAFILTTRNILFCYIYSNSFNFLGVNS
jgi:hypothetical protein